MYLVPSIGYCWLSKETFLEREKIHRAYRQLQLDAGIQGRYDCALYPKEGFLPSVTDEDGDVLTPANLRGEDFELDRVKNCRGKNTVDADHGASDTSLLQDTIENA